MNKIVIGIDQSYKNTGVSICVDGELKRVSSINLGALNSNSEKRNYLRKRFDKLFNKMALKSKIEACELVIIIERIRLRSQGFININYIKSIGALNALVVDVACKYNIPIYSVDTRSWKSQIVGSSKPLSNNYGIDPEKWRTIKYVCSIGFKESLIVEVSKRKKKGVIEKDGKRFTFNDDAADSACIALYGFISKPLLEEEH